MADLIRELWPFLLGGEDEQLGGCGSEDGSGLGYGHAAGCEFADGHGYGAGLDAPCTAGDEECWGFGFGIAPGQSEAEDEENGSGDGYNPGTGIKRINGMEVRDIDGTLAIITIEQQDATRGFVLREDMSLHPCWIVNQDGVYAFGSTYAQALAELDEILEEIQIIKDLQSGVIPVLG